MKNENAFATKNQRYDVSTAGRCPNILYVVTKILVKSKLYLTWCQPLTRQIFRTTSTFWNIPAT